MSRRPLATILLSMRPPNHTQLLAGLLRLWVGRPRLTPRGLLVGAVIGGAALFLTALTYNAERPPGIDTQGHLFKGWAIARDAERDLFSTHAWTQD